jgi:hypothetical protein
MQLNPLAPLSEDQRAVADRIQGVLVRKNADGSYRYSKEECRAFIVAVVFDLGLEVPKELEGVFLRFLAQIKVPEDASDEAVVEAIRQHFLDHPLNPELLAEIAEIARSEHVSGKDGRDDAAVAARVGRARSVGRDGALRAPAAGPGGKSSAPVKVTKGLR